VALISWEKQVSDSIARLVEAQHHVEELARSPQAPRGAIMCLDLACGSVATALVALGHSTP
jgi:hypothetical protein